MGQALYRKYRSRSLDEVVGQKHITDTLKQALKSGRISHAYLFTGPRGTGKTSVARILAHAVNGLEYQHEDNPIDIIEIDAASNRGIDEIRDLREKVYNAPIAGKYKVYIIDEVHMLTTPAFNALLKTLEEPPAHVIFILATTEAHKLPETIVSRTQRHIFRPVDLPDVIGHLQTIAKAENIKIDQDALQLIAEHGGGSFRDSISLLDQAGSSSDKIDRRAAEQLLGIPADSSVASILGAIACGDNQQIISQLEAMLQSGLQPAGIAKKLGQALRQEIITSNTSFPLAEQLQFMRQLLLVAPAHEPARMLEIVLLSQSTSKDVSSIKPVAPTAKPAAAPAPKIAPSPSIAAEQTTRLATTEAPAKQPISDMKQPAAAPAHKPVDAGPELDPAVWTDILNALKRNHNTLYGVLRMAVPEFEPGLLRLRFQFAFHQKRMNEAKHRSIVVDTILHVTGQSLTIDCVHDSETLIGNGPIGSNHPAAAPEPAEAMPQPLTTISNIFGGGELLES